MTVGKRMRNARRSAVRLWFATSGLCAGIVLAVFMAVLARFDR